MSLAIFWDLLFRSSPPVQIAKAMEDQLLIVLLENEYTRANHTLDPDQIFSQLGIWLI